MLNHPWGILHLSKIMLALTFGRDISTPETALAGVEYCSSFERHDLVNIITEEFHGRNENTESGVRFTA